MNFKWDSGEENDEREELEAQETKKWCTYSIITGAAELYYLKVFSGCCCNEQEFSAFHRH